MSASYEEAIREWISRRLRQRRSGIARTRDQIRNVRFGCESGWPGTDVTASEPDIASFNCEITGGFGWTPHQENIEDITPADLIAECLAIYHELNTPPANPADQEHT